ncbi:MAG: hypothetical protein RL291_1355 [Pseudomonadota bacterium]|jgi:hypothetical protein
MMRRLLYTATAAAVITIAASNEVRADGCTVILCLSHPAGWSSVPECIRPVQQAWKDLSKGRLPFCAFVGSGADRPRIAYVPDGDRTYRDADGQDWPVMVRVLEVPLADGTVMRSRF